MNILLILSIHFVCKCSIYQLKPDLDRNIDVIMILKKKKTSLMPLCLTIITFNFNVILEIVFISIKSQHLLKHMF